MKTTSSNESDKPYKQYKIREEKQRDLDIPEVGTIHGRSKDLLLVDNTQCAPSNFIKLME